MKKEIVDFRKSEWFDFDISAQKPTSVLAMASIVGDKIYLFYWGTHGNTQEWSVISSLIGSIRSMAVLTKRGNIILPEYTSDSAWSGKNTKYSDVIYTQLRDYYDSGLIKDSGKVYIGNWASKKGIYIGLVKNLLKTDTSKLPSYLIMYHGTSSDRYDTIQNEGLKGVPRNLRAWKNDLLKKVPYRDEAVYITADLGQAEYYAKKATKVARRNGVKNANPIVFQIKIPRSAYGNLMPDDDFLQTKFGGKYKPSQDVDQLKFNFFEPNWIDSLKNFAQVAYVGNIPPEWISVSPYKNMNYKKDVKENKLSLKSILKEAMIILPFDVRSSGVGDFYIQMDGTNAGKPYKVKPERGNYYAVITDKTVLMPRILLLCS